MGLLLLAELVAALVLAVRQLFDGAWGAAFASLLAGAVAMTFTFVLYRLVKRGVPDARRPLPRDRGIPRPPHGTPYRGPH